MATGTSLSLAPHLPDPEHAHGNIAAIPSRLTIVKAPPGQGVVDSSAAPCEASPMALTNALRTRASRHDVHGTGPTCALLVSDRYPATTPRVPGCSVVVPSADAASRGHMARPSPVLLGEQAGIKR